MKAKAFLKIMIGCIALLSAPLVYGQGNTDSTWKHTRKNIVRYNISSAILFGPGKCIIFGYERLIKPHQSFSINGGSIALPKLISFSTDSFNLNENNKRTGFNVSADYRFYLAKENKYPAPRGIYLGPFYSYNQFNSTNDWAHRGAVIGAQLSTDTKLQIHTIGIELGYQFLFWKRVSLDIVIIGPGISSYRLQTKIDGNLTGADQEQLQDATLDLIAQKFPGLTAVLEDRELDNNGQMSTWNCGFRSLMHLGFNF